MVTSVRYIRSHIVSPCCLPEEIWSVFSLRVLVSVISEHLNTLSAPNALIVAVYLDVMAMKSYAFIGKRRLVVAYTRDYFPSAQVRHQLKKKSGA